MSEVTCASAIAEARRRGVDTLDAQVLLARILGTTRTGVIAHPERALLPAQGERWQDWVGRRSDGEPLAYLIGEKDFHGLCLEVTRDVLVPRPETELLVEWALDRMQGLPDAATLVDLGTGSGAIALAIKQGRPQARVTATDVSASALAVAARNAGRLGLDIDFVAGTWWNPLGTRRFDVVVANPPYIAGEDPHLAALRHEPLGALSPGRDGLAALRTIVDGAPDHLEPGGWLLVEHGFDQQEPVRARMTAAGLTQVETRADLAGRPRVTAARRPGDAV